MTVLVGAVAPETLPHNFARPVIFADAPGKRGGEMADLAEFLHAQLLGLEEGLVNAHRKPGVAIHEGAADAHRMHDREYARLAKISLLDGRIIREHAADMGCTVEKAGRRPRAEQAVDIAIGQHVGQGAVLRDRRVIDIGRQLDLCALAAPGLLEAAAPPFDVVRLDAVLVLQNAPDPDVRGHLVFGQPDRPALEIWRALDAAIGASVDPTVAEQPRYERRNGEIVG